MNEKELLDQPESNETSIENDDFFGDIDNEFIDNEPKEISVDSDDESESIPTDTESEEKEEEIDYKPFLDAISKKAKYNKESIQVDSMDDVINNFQKGLNYDKMVEKLNSLENSKVFSYVSQKANQLGMTVEEYMNSVEQYEQEQEQIRQQEKIEEMVSNGVPEEIAKEVVATSQLRKELQEEKNRLEKEKQEREANENKNKEYAEFLEAFPNVKAEDIPREVFLNAQKSNLKTAYLEWQNAELQKQIEINKTNSKNATSSVGSTTQYGAKDETANSDLFLEGFNSV